jgi:hypothetical protein
MCMCRSPLVPALAALGATALLGACDTSGGAAVPTSGPAQSTFNGYKSMPPMGGCMDCDEDQYRALIDYMSGTKLK